MDVTVIIMVIAALLLLVIFHFGVWFAQVSHDFVRLNALVEESWSSINVKLGRRHAIISDLVAVVEQHNVHEQLVVADVKKMLSLSMHAAEVEDKIVAEGNLTKALYKLFAVAEKYPPLRGSEHLVGLRKDFAVIEREMLFSRHYYNDAARNYNVRIAVFPASVVASMMELHKKLYF